MSPLLGFDLSIYIGLSHIATGLWLTYVTI